MSTSKNLPGSLHPSPKQNKGKGAVIDSPSPARGSPSGATSGGTESTRPFSDPASSGRSKQQDSQLPDTEGEEDAGASQLSPLMRDMPLLDDSATRLAFHSQEGLSIPESYTDALLDGGILSVVQNTSDVDFTLEMTHPDLGRLQFQLIYSPGDDACLFVNKQKVGVLLEPLGASAAHQATSDDDGDNDGGSDSGGDSDNAQFLVQDSYMVQPGIWRVSVPPIVPSAPTLPVLDFLVLRRKFSVTMTAPTSMPAGPSDTLLGIPGLAKRKALAASQESGETSSKRPRTSADLTSVFMELPRGHGRGQQLLPRRGGTSTEGGLTTQELHPNPLLKLTDGSVAVVQVQHRPAKDVPLGPADYSLTRITRIAETRATSVFSADHSGLSDRVIAKVLKPNRKTLQSYALNFVQEIKFLSVCQHENIVRLQAFDSRLFTILLEPLPPDLAHQNVPFALNDAEAVLRGVCAGLAHLADKNIVHNDIKPANIAFSRQRGAVILDFGLATTGLKVSNGGTPWYVPPDYLSGNRGFPGDVWATGVTMLYVLGSIPLPEKSEKGWPIAEVLDINAQAGTQMDKWVQKVATARGQLGQQSKVAGLVFLMLGNRLERITAAQVVASFSQ